MEALSRNCIEKRPDFCQFFKKTSLLEIELCYNTDRAFSRFH